MTRSDYERTLRMMEHVRELSYEAETVAEEKRLLRDYRRMWESIEPHATGRQDRSPAIHGHEDAAEAANPFPAQIPT